MLCEIAQKHLQLLAERWRRGPSHDVTANDSSAESLIAARHCIFSKQIFMLISERNSIEASARERVVNYNCLVH